MHPHVQREHQGFEGEEILEEAGEKAQTYVQAVSLLCLLTQLYVKRRLSRQLRCRDSKYS